MPPDKGKELLKLKDVAEEEAGSGGKKDSGDHRVRLFASNELDIVSEINGFSSGRLSPYPAMVRRLHIYQPSVHPYLARRWRPRRRRVHRAIQTQRRGQTRPVSIAEGFRVEYSRYNRSRTGLDWLISYLPKVPHLLLLQIKQVYELLSANYVEDVQAAFRFQYTAEFLEWYTSISFPCVITRSISVFLQGVETARMAE